MPRLLFVRCVLFSEIDIALCLYYKMDFCNFKAFFLYFFKASTDFPLLSIIFHSFVGKHKVSTRFLCTKNRPGFLLRKPGRSYTLLVLFQALTQSLAGGPDRNLSGCQNYRAFEVTMIRHFIKFPAEGQTLSRLCTRPRYPELAYRQ